MTLIQHAERELKEAGLFNKDSDYSGMIGKAVLELVKTFSKQGHSGYSASMVLYLFNRLGSCKSINPITNNPKDWMEVSDDMWQSRREPNLFSTDGGKTYYDVDDKKRKTKKSVSYSINS